MTLSQVGRAIRYYRRLHDITQAQLADQADLSLAVITRLEQGKGHHISTRALTELARALKVRPHELIEKAESYEHANAS